MKKSKEVGERIKDITSKTICPAFEALNYIYRIYGKDAMIIQALKDILDYIDAIEKEEQL